MQNYCKDIQGFPSYAIRRRITGNYFSTFRGRFSSDAVSCPRIMEFSLLERRYTSARADAVVAFALRYSSGVGPLQILETVTGSEIHRHRRLV
jgi:hypothetical protein